MNFTTYQPAVDVAPKSTATNGSASSVSHTTETDLFVCTDPRYCEKSQLTLYIDQVLSSATKVAYGIYFSRDDGVTWFKLSVEDLTTNKGDLVDIPPYVDSNSPSQSISGTTHYRTIFNTEMPACNAFKVTGLATTADAGAVVISPMVRDN